MIRKLISVPGCIDAMRYEYDQYLMRHLQTSAAHRKMMSTDFDHHSVMKALVGEIMEPETEREPGIESVPSQGAIEALLDQGVDISYATEMATAGLKRLVYEISACLPGITFAQLKNGSMDFCNDMDLYVTFEEKV